jgi:MFS-type transporter involved in bile tolerance (Atg22 family)
LAGERTVSPARRDTPQQRGWYFYDWANSSFPTTVGTVFFGPYLIEVARAAMAKGELTATFTALGKHERDFANGRLAEEREALFIQALHAAGREVEAAARTERFNKQFPDSLLQP